MYDWRYAFGADYNSLWGGGDSPRHFPFLPLFLFCASPLLLPLSLNCPFPFHRRPFRVTLAREFRGAL